MLHVENTTQFKRDLKLSKKRGCDLAALNNIMNLIEYEKPLSPKLKDHPLMGAWVGHRELHINPDWLLVYKILPKEKVVIFVRTGTHSDLFD